MGNCFRGKIVAMCSSPAVTVVANKETRYSEQESCRLCKCNY